MSAEKMLTFIRSGGRDPYENQALEAYLFEKMPWNSELVLFYVNRPAVLIGRHQAVRSETRPAYLKSMGIDLLRRISGGGGVYHDEGNLNIAFIGHGKHFDRRESLDRLRSLLGFLDLPIGIRDDLDLLLEGRKFSGSAYLVRGQRSLHHATLLVNSDLRALAEALLPEYGGDQSGGTAVASRRSMTCNLSEFIPGLGVERVYDALHSELSSAEFIERERDAPGRENEIKKYYDKFRNIAWIEKDPGMRG